MNLPSGLIPTADCYDPEKGKRKIKAYNTSGELLVASSIRYMQVKAVIIKNFIKFTGLTAVLFKRKMKKSLLSLKAKVVFCCLL